jgi:hypothetical protein
MEYTIMDGIDTDELAVRLKEVCKQRPFFFYDILKAFESIPYRDILLAWGRMREQVKFDRDEEGHYVYAEEV